MASAGSGLLALLDTLTFPELLAIVVIALVVLGPEKLPGAARTAGEWVQKLRALSASLESEVREVLDDPSMQPIRELGEFAAQPRRKLAEYARSAGADDTPPATPATPATTPVVTTSPIPAVDPAPEPVGDAEAALEVDLAPQPATPLDDTVLDDTAAADAEPAPADEPGPADEPATADVPVTKIVAVGPDLPMAQLTPDQDESSDPRSIAQ